MRPANGDEKAEAETEPGTGTETSQTGAEPRTRTEQRQRRAAVAAKRRTPTGDEKANTATWPDGERGDRRSCTPTRPEAGKAAEKARERTKADGRDMGHQKGAGTEKTTKTIIGHEH